MSDVGKAWTGRAAPLTGGRPLPVPGIAVLLWLLLAAAAVLWGLSSDMPAEILSYQEDIVFSPTPVGTLPLYVGGHSEIALRRAGALGDGWLGQQSLDAIDTHELEAAHAAITVAAADAGRDPATLRIVLRLVDSAGRSDEVARTLPALEAAGVSEVIVDLDWDAGDPAADYAELSA